MLFPRTFATPPLVMLRVLCGAALLSTLPGQGAGVRSRHRCTRASRDAEKSFARPATDACRSATMCAGERRLGSIGMGSRQMDTARLAGSNWGTVQGQPKLKDGVLRESPPQETRA